MPPEGYYWENEKEQLAWTETLEKCCS
jgi:hypothetical protein